MGFELGTNGIAVCCMRMRGVNIALKVAFSLMVRTFIACLITMH
jgi:hypothetical protein